MCYLTGFLGALWMLDLARTKTPSVGELVLEVLGKIYACVAVGLGAILCIIWQEREDALLHVWKAEDEKRE